MVLQKYGALNGATGASMKTILNTGLGWMMRPVKIFNIWEGLFWVLQEVDSKKNRES